MNYVLTWGAARCPCRDWRDLQRAIRILHNSCGVSYRRMRVHHEERA